MATPEKTLAVKTHAEDLARILRVHGYVTTGDADTLSLDLVKLLERTYDSGVRDMASAMQRERDRVRRGW